VRETTVAPLAQVEEFDKHRPAAKLRTQTRQAARNQKRVPDRPRFEWSARRWQDCTGAFRRALPRRCPSGGHASACLENDRQRQKGPSEHCRASIQRKGAFVWKPHKSAISCVSALSTGSGHEPCGWSFTGGNGSGPEPDCSRDWSGSAGGIVGFRVVYYGLIVRGLSWIGGLILAFDRYSRRSCGSCIVYFRAWRDGTTQFSASCVNGHVEYRYIGVVRLPGRAATLWDRQANWTSIVGFCESSLPFTGSRSEALQATGRFSATGGHFRVTASPA